MPGAMSICHIGVPPSKRTTDALPWESPDPVARMLAAEYLVSDSVLR